MRHVSPEPMSGCWLWTGTTDRFGYGQSWHNGRHAKSHRLSWFLAYGSDAGEMLVLHRCDNPPCVNPAHLFLGTNIDNVRDMMRKGRTRKSMSHCKRGHSLEDAHITGQGHRDCRQCRLFRGANRRAALAAISKVLGS